jgi:hypothetical protein
MRSLGGPHLRPVLGTILLMAHFNSLRKSYLLPNCDRVSRCMSLQQNTLSKFHSRQIHVRSKVVCKEFQQQIS